MEYLEPSGAFGMGIWRPLVIGENIRRSGLGRTEPAHGTALRIIRPNVPPRLPSTTHMKWTGID